MCLDIGHPQPGLHHVYGAFYCLSVLTQVYTVKSLRVRHGRALMAAIAQT